MKWLFIRQSRLLVLFGCLFLLQSASWSDRIQLKDGTTLKCKILSETVSKESGIRYLQIQINKSLVWVNKENIEILEKTADQTQDNLDFQETIKKLLGEGKLLPDLQKQLTFANAPKPAKTEIPFTIKTLKGWAYLYKDQKAIDSRERIPLKDQKTIPSGYTLILSPNTHLTLGLGEFGEIGLDGGTNIRFEDIIFDRSTQSYRINLQLNKGKCWINVDSPNTSWKRIIFSVNQIRSVLQNSRLYVQVTGKNASTDITYLSGKNELNFWRGQEGPFLVQVGQTLKSAPNTAKLPVENTPNLAALQDRYTKWLEWSPEAFAVDLKEELPSLYTFPAFGVLPALHPYSIAVDHSLVFPPVIRTMGEILAEYRKALEKYKYDTGKYPATAHGLKALTESLKVSGWRGSYIAADLPAKDLWGEPFVYEVFKEKGKEIPDIRSKGPNQKDDRGLGDDIR